MKRDLKKAPARRPLSIVVLLVAFLLISLSGWTRMLYSILNWYWLNYAGVKPGPLYQAVTGGVWGLAGLVALVWLWRRLPGFRLAGSAAAIFLALIYWADRLIFANSGTGGQNTIFAAAVTIMGLGYVMITLRPWQEPKDENVKD